MRDGGDRPGRRSRRAGGHRRRTAMLALALPLLLAACGEDDAAAPTPAPVPTAESATATATVSPPDTGSPAAQSGDPRTFGDLADRVNTAWADVDAFRSVFVLTSHGATASPAAGSPVASPVGPGEPFELRREVVVPDRQRLEQRSGGRVVSEGIVVGGRVYVRGAAARVLLPEAEATAWVSGDAALLSSLAGADPLLSRIVAPIESPLAAVPDNLRPQELRPLGPVEVDGRACRAFGAADTTRTGDRVDITVAIDADDLPCFLDTRSGRSGGRETFGSYGDPFAIGPPAEAVPASPPAGPATPAGRD